MQRQFGDARRSLVEVLNLGMILNFIFSLIFIGGWLGSPIIGLVLMFASLPIKKPQIESRYEVSHQNAETIFRVHAASYPNPEIIVAGRFLLFGWFLLPILVALSCFYHAARARKRLMENWGDVTIVADGAKISAIDPVTGNTRVALDVSKIHRLVLRNEVFKFEGSSTQTVAFANTGTAQGAAFAAGVAAVQLGQLAGAQMRKEIGNRAYQLDVDAGGRAYTLARGMDEMTAEGLLHDLAKASGF